jgi:hypothetical protein
MRYSYIVWKLLTYNGAKKCYDFWIEKNYDDGEKIKQ